MLIKILLGLAGLLAIAATVVALQPAQFTISRSTRIAAPAATVFPLVNDLRRFQEWSPWAKLDPAMKTRMEGPTEGTGSQYAWVGNDQVGEGRMTITESRPGELVRMKLEFIKPFTATNDTLFTLKPVGQETEITWTMSGHNNFMFKAVGLIMNMEKMCGGQFEEGLAQMKAIAEAAPAKAPVEIAAAAPTN